MNEKVEKQTESNIKIRLLLQAQSTFPIFCCLLVKNHKIPAVSSSISCTEHSFLQDVNMRCIVFFGSWFVVNFCFVFFFLFGFLIFNFNFLLLFFLLYSDLKHFCGDLVQAQKYGSSLSILLSENVL